MIGIFISVIIPLFLSAIGAVFAFYGWKGFRQRREQIANSVPAVGFIIEIVPISINGRRFYNPKVAFTTGQGHRVVFVSDYGANRKTFQINQQIEIFYNPQNPQQAGIKSDPNANLLVSGLMIGGGIVAVGGLIFAVIEVFVYILIFSKR